MKSVFIPLLFVATAFSQAPSTQPLAACGPSNIRFKVTANNSPEALAPAAPGTARVYFIHDAGSVNSFSPAYPTTRYAIDGAWAGANHSDSWFAVTVAPGEHHVCTNLQSSLVNDRVVLAHFTAESGRVYYFRTQLVMSGQVELLELDTIDSDEGKYLVDSYPMSEWKARK